MNMAAGTTARVSVGFIMMPFSVVKVRFEVRSHSVHFKYSLISFF
jgi:hypothetical protein